ncbi:phosphatases II [Corynespora cassiicola Philippines]|uniref:protein-tyrosine-phosphatase n=1 Tax=Corynespora cassiicola Philippines TaxID=1448308 RepID=A0A2T2N9U6_CORCC|nr:phosphatases II [Corynespora cassiicola Philippines]
MPPIKGTNFASLDEIPGLYISDIIVPSSPSQLQQHEITHVLTAMNRRAWPSIPPELEIAHKTLPLEDDALDDLLELVEEACDWIKNALGGKQKDESAEEHCELTGTLCAKTRQPRVLVHCLQGISRSGSIVVAYMMRQLCLDYPTALALVRRHRDVITPNDGFAEQLVIWHQMEYECKGQDGSDKKLYSDWKKSRDDLLKSGQEEGNRVRARSLAHLAARIGARRM